MGYLDEREAQARQEYENDISAAKAKLERVLAAIAILRDDSSTSVSSPRTKKKSTINRPKRSSSAADEINGAQIVKEISIQMSGEYDNRAFLIKAEEAYPIVAQYPKLIRDTLSKLAKSGKYGIKTVQPRKGRIPAIYRTIKSPSQEVEG